jgi:hypothetical protein
MLLEFSLQRRILLPQPINDLLGVRAPPLVELGDVAFLV